MAKALTFKLRGPDVLTLELASVLSADAWYEFKPLFTIVHANLRARKAGNGGEEMLRLRAYDKLQNLVQQGRVEKNGKSYRGVVAALAALTEHMAADHCETLLRKAKIQATAAAAAE